MTVFRKTIVCENVKQAAEMLKQGLLVAFPTETVYGLGADARNRVSVAGIFESKQRPQFDPLIVHVASLQQVQEITTEFSPRARRLADHFWPGPLTLVLPKHPRIPDLVTSGLDGVGVRIPDHSLARELLTAVGRPVAAPSANPFGGISPTTAQHVLDGLQGRVDGILDGGPCGVGVESTVISLMDATPMLLRPGGLPKEDIEAVIGPIAQATSNPEFSDAAQPAPGMLSRHYAPRTPLHLIDCDSVCAAWPDQKCGLLTYGNAPHDSDFQHIVHLGDVQDLKTCAANFFAGLRCLDSAGLDVIIARRFPNTGLGVALNDRLQRAATT